MSGLGWGIGLIIALFFIIFFGYYIVCEMVYNGRTIGKAVFKLRVIRENGMPVSFTAALIRNIFKITIDMLGVGLILIMFTKMNTTYIAKLANTPLL
jgi:uncharacterized RDD family membrane protein YckC